MGSEMSTFNVKDGYAEGLVRGFRSGFLTPEDYRKLGLADTLEDLRSALDDTAYGSFLANEPLPLTVATIGAKCQEKLALEFRFIQAEANQPLSKFLDYLSYEKMIDNIIFLIQGTLNKKPAEELLARMDPLGWFPELRAITAIDLSGGYEDLYRTLLSDTPVAPYFEEYVETHRAANDEQLASMSEVVSWFSELDLELMRNVLKKAWLEDFHQFCVGLGGTTAEVMGNILKCECDFRILIVTLNSLTRASSSAANNVDRAMFFPRVGHLYPEGYDKLRNAWTDAAIRAALGGYEPYLQAYEACKGMYVEDIPGGSGGPAVVEAGSSSIEDLLYRQQLRLYELTFEQSMHYGLFYGWMKLKEQEIRNILWIAEMITINKKEAIDQILPIFEPRP